MSVKVIYEPFATAARRLRNEALNLPRNGIEDRRSQTLVATQPCGENPTCQSTAVLDMHPRIPFAILDDIYAAVQSRAILTPTALRLSGRGPAKPHIMAAVFDG